MISINELSIEELEKHALNMEIRLIRVSDILSQNTYQGQRFRKILGNKAKEKLSNEKHRRAGRLLHSINKRSCLVWDRLEELDPETAS